MSICSNNQNIVDGISPHNLVCQSDNSIKLIRFIGNKLGIVKGINELASIDLSSFYIPIENYNIQTISLCPDEIKKIDVSGISINGKRRKTFQFEFTNNIKKLEISRAENIIETIDIITEDMEDTEDMDINSAISYIINNSKIIRASKKENTNDIILLTCISSGDDIDILSVSETGEIVDLEIIQDAFRYPEFDVVKYLLLFVDFDKLTNKNEQTIEYKFNDDIEDKWYKSSRILMLSGTDNLKDEDDNLIKTISVKNTSPCRITLNILTAL